jgi:hypothetical protein
MAHMTPDAGASTGGFRVDRPFGWGLLLIGDRTLQEVPSIDPDAAVAATGSCVGVRHAQDVDLGSGDNEFRVSLGVRLGQPTETSVCFDGVIDVPSGEITFGDADRQDSLDVVPGRWRVQVNLEPEDFPEHAEIWISSAS